MPTLYTTTINFWSSKDQPDPEVDDKIIRECQSMGAEMVDVERAWKGTSISVHLSNQWGESYSLDFFREIKEQHPDYSLSLYTDYNSHEEEI